MEKQELIDFWKSTSDKDFITMMNLLKSKDYHWSLFMGHLVIEKILKAIYLKNTKDENQPPRTHDLLLLAKRAKIDPSENQQDLFDMITTFNISARYPDYKHSFYKKCTSSYTKERIDEIKELREWLIIELENK